MFGFGGEKDVIGPPGTLHQAGDDGLRLKSVAQLKQNRLDPMLLQLGFTIMRQQLLLLIIQFTQPGQKSLRLRQRLRPPGIGSQQMIQVMVGEEILIIVECVDD